MMNAQILENIIESGENWYNAYSGELDYSKTLLVITPTTYPHVLQSDKSIYSRRFLFDRVTSVTKAFYEGQGIKSIVAGPSGLGASGGLLYGALVAWLIAHKDFLRFIPFAFDIAKKLFLKYKKYKSDKNLLFLRSVRFKIQLDLSLFIDEGEYSKDLVPYLQQLIANVEVLSNKLSADIIGAECFISYGVYDLQSDKHANVDLSNVLNRSMSAKMITRLSKVKASEDFRELYVKKTKLGYKIRKR